MEAASSPSPAVANPLDDHLGYHLRRASSFLMTTLADRLGEVGLTIVETSILVLIEHNPGIFQSEIGRILGIKRANVAPLAASLERRGLVGRTSPEGRLVGLSTTELGEATAARAEGIMRENDARLFGDLSDDSRRALRIALEALWQNGAGRGDLA